MIKGKDLEAKRFEVKRFILALTIGIFFFLGISIIVMPQLPALIRVPLGLIIMKLSFDKIINEASSMDPCIFICAVGMLAGLLILMILIILYILPVYDISVLSRPQIYPSL